MECSALVINLPHCTERWKRIQEDFKNTSFKLTRYDGVMITDESISRKDRGYIGLARTHIQIVKEAKEKGIKTVLILEDDCKPEPNFESHWKKIKDYLDNHLDEWEVFNGGICGIESISKVLVIDNIILLKEKGGCFTHWLYLNVDKAYDKLMNWELTKQEIDLYYSHNFDHYTCYPLLAEQHSGYSEIGERHKDWSLNFNMARLDFRRHLINVRNEVLSNILM
jgi:GR25 family glycosyltransferase involved in LPS biosynthesis